MTRLLLICLAIVVSLAPALVVAQNYPGPAAPGRNPPPAGPRDYTLPPPVHAIPAAGPGAVRTAANPQQQPGAPNGYRGMPAAAPAIAPAVAPAMPAQPAWAAQMTLADQKWVEDVLTFWEQRSDKTALFECKFQRWDYDPVFGPSNGKFKTYAEGIVKYGKPDKGVYRVEKLSSYVAPAKDGDKEYFDQDPSFGEHWVCDGQRIFEFDARKKQLVERALLPEMRNKAIADGPLPFMFGAKAATIKARYWIHGLPQSGNGKYWLEAVPKARQDAQNFSRVIIVLDEKDFLPESLQVFAPNFDEQKNPAKQTYVFKDRVTPDPKNLLGKLGDKLNPVGFFKTDDFNPKLPAGWKKIVENDMAAAPPAPPRQTPPLSPR